MLFTGITIKQNLKERYEGEPQTIFFHVSTLNLMTEGIQVIIWKINYYMMEAVTVAWSETFKYFIRVDG